MKGMLLPVVERMTDDVGLWRWLPRQSALSYPATPAALQKDSVRGLARDVAIPTITQHCTRVWRCSPPLPLPPPTSLNVKLFCTNLPRTELICTISSNRASQRVQSSRPTTVRTPRRHVTASHGKRSESVTGTRLSLAALSRRHDAISRARDDASFVRSAASTWLISPCAGGSASRATPLFLPSSLTYSPPSYPAHLLSNIDGFLIDFNCKLFRT